MIGDAVAVRPVLPVRRWVYALAAAAAVVVLAEHLRHVMPTPTVPAPMVGMADMGRAPIDRMPGMHHGAGSLTSLWAWWMVMVIAMMFPLAAAGADRIAANGLWHRRHVAAAEFLLAYLALWSLFGLLATWLTISVWPHGAPAVAPVAVLLVSAAWHVTPARRRALRRCGKPTRVRVRGWRADADCMTAGIAAGRPCLMTCAPMMIVMAVAHSAVLMVALSALMLGERRRGPNPTRRLGRPHEALCLVLFAGLAGVWAVVLHRDLP